MNMTLIETDTLKGLKNAWLSPRGELITDAPGFCSSGAWHEALAGYILMDIQGLRTTYEAHEFARKDTPYAYTYEYLESLGWIRLCGWGSIIKWVLPEDMRLTRQQRGVIEEWCAANNVPWEKAFSLGPGQLVP